MDEGQVLQAQESGHRNAAPLSRRERHPVIGIGAEGLVEVHEALFNVLLVLVGIHIAGVIVDIVLTRDNLVLAMITGYKRMPAGAEKAGAGPVSNGRAAIVLVIAIALTVFLVSL